MRTLDVTYKTAWFTTHRIREAMVSGKLPPMGGPGETVEIDETFIGKKEDHPVRRGFAHKHAVMTLVQRCRSPRWKRSFSQSEGRQLAATRLRMD